MHFQEQEIRTLHSPCSDESALLKEMRIHLFINMYFLLISQQIERDESQMFGPAYYFHFLLLGKVQNTNK